MSNPLVLRTLFDEDTLEPLVRRTLARERRAWPELWLAVAPAIEEMAGRFCVAGRLSAHEDERRDVVVDVMEHLQANDFERLRPFHDALRRRDGSARVWLSTVTRRSAVSHTREHPENFGGDERRWADLVPLPEDLEEQLPVPARAARAADAHGILAYAARELPEAQVTALRLWLVGHGPDEIAAVLGLASAPAADRLVRAAIKALRRRFLNEDDRRVCPG